MKIDFKKLNEMLKVALGEDNSSETFIPQDILESLIKYNFYNTTTPGQARMNKVFLNHDISKEIEAAGYRTNKDGFKQDLIPNNQGILVQYDRSKYFLSVINGYYGTVQSSYNTIFIGSYGTLEQLTKNLSKLAEQVNRDQLQKLNAAKVKNDEKLAKEAAKHAARREKHPDWYDENGKYLGSPAKRKRDEKERKEWEEHKKRQEELKRQKEEYLKQFGLNQYYYDDNTFSLNKEKAAKEAGGVEFSSWKEGAAELWIPASVQKPKRDGHWTQPKTTILRYPIRESNKYSAINEMYKLLTNRDYAKAKFDKWFDGYAVNNTLSGLSRLESIITGLEEMRKMEINR